MQIPMAFRFPVVGSMGWLVALVVIGAGASLLPAWRAASVSIREALSYE
jgi:ABC-type lipoprotein release transport system permease subunit